MVIHGVYMIGLKEIVSYNFHPRERCLGPLVPELRARNLKSKSLEKSDSPLSTVTYPNVPFDESCVNA